jgi:hypothetical protein
MSDSSQFVAESLAELLVAIANGVREAQEALSQMPVLDTFGRPMPSYHLPFLDFQLQVDMETTENSTGNRLLRVLPLATSQKSSTSQISSTLSGRFVAIPPGEGLPIPVLRLTHSLDDELGHLLNIQLTNTAGEPLVGVPVELNLNTAASIQLSAVEGAALTNLANTRLRNVLLTTDNQGKANSVLELDANLPAKASIVVTAEYGQFSASVNVIAGNRP